jgi:plastocyanin
VRTAIIAGALGLVVFSQGVDPGDQRTPQTHTVSIVDMRFQPEMLTVTAGDTVVWVNKDLVPHTATSEARGFDSKTIEAGKSWRYTVRAKGNIVYQCTFHPSMTATLRVK